MVDYNQTDAMHDSNMPKINDMLNSMTNLPFAHTQPLLSIKNWAVWSPNHATSIPAHLKRRCSQATKMALEVANQAMGDNRIDYAIFASQHGEIARSVTLLQDISAKTILSPTNFSQSVHNTAAGLFSVMHNLRVDTTSIAAGDATFFMGMLEASSWLKSNPHQIVLLVIFDERMPKEYQSLQIKNGDCEHAVAFLLTEHASSSATSYLSFTLQQSIFSAVVTAVDDDASAKLDANKNPPLAVEFLQWLLDPVSAELVQKTSRYACKWDKDSWASY